MENSVGGVCAISSVVNSTYTANMGLVTDHVNQEMCIGAKEPKIITAPQHLVCRVVQSLHINHMQMGIIEVFICRILNAVVQCM